MSTDVAASAERKVFRRLIPIAMLLLFVNLIDRTNISFAALQMNEDLGLTPAVYGFAAGIFFVGYCVFEIPSNLLLVRVGARRWLARIMISWGVVVLAMAWVNGSRSLYLVRFLLGVAEAGLLPGLLYYLAAWIPPTRRALAYSALMSTTALSSLLGGPISTGLMSLSGLGGLRGWQIMFIAESLLTVLIGVGVLWKLPETPLQASWLSPGEREHLLRSQLAQDGEKPLTATPVWRGVLTDRRVLAATLLNFFLICCNFGTVYWLPLILKSLDLATWKIGLLTCVPYGLGGAAMLLWGRSSDRTADRRWHLVLGKIVAVLGYLWAAVTDQPVMFFAALCVAIMGIWSTFGVFWAYTSDILERRTAATGLAFVNSVSTLGGLVGPALIGLLRERTHGFSSSLFGIALLAGTAAVLASRLKERSSPLLST